MISSSTYSLCIIRWVWWSVHLSFIQWIDSNGRSWYTSVIGEEVQIDLSSDTLISQRTNQQSKSPAQFDPRSSVWNGTVWTSKDDLSNEQLKMGWFWSTQQKDSEVMWQSQPRCCWGCHIRELIVLWKPHSETLEGIDLEGRDNMSKSCSDSRFSEAVMRFDMLLCAFLGCKIWHYMKYVHDMYVYIYIFIHHPSFSRLKKKHARSVKMVRQGKSSGLSASFTQVCDVRDNKLHVLQYSGESSTQAWW